MLKKIYQIAFFLLPLVFLLFLGFFLETSKTTSDLESRKLTPLPGKFYIQRNSFEKYISDHLPFREPLLSLYFSLNLKLLSSETNNIIGKDGWIFQIKNDTTNNLPVLLSYKNYTLLSHNEKKTIIKNLLYIQEWCDENKVKFYLLFPPDKGRIYARFVPEFILRRNKESSVAQLKKHIPQKINVIPLEKELTDLSFKTNEHIYFKEDTHWSEDGAFFVYQELIKKIKNDFPKLNPLSKKDFYIVKTIPFVPYQTGNYLLFKHGNQYMPQLLKKNAVYNHYSYKNINEIKIQREFNFKDSTYSKGHPLNVYIIGDSFATYLHPFLSATFSRVRAYRFNLPGSKWGIKFNERIKEFQKEKPDILILSVSDLKLKDLLKVE